MTRAMFLGAIGICASILLAGAMSRQDPPPDPEQVVLLEAWKHYTTPGAEHAMLARRIGRWDVRIREWAEPFATPDESYGVSEIESIMGGRFTLERLEGERDGRPFSGMGLLGYDNLVERFTSNWVDSFGTGMIHYEGRYDEKTETLAMTGVRPDVVARRYGPTQLTLRRVDENGFVLTVRETAESSFDWTVLELTYTRRR